MKYIFLLAVIFALPFFPAVFSRLMRQSQKAARERARQEEARKILEVGVEASEDEIKSAHKRLIQKNHPDTGGSQYFAAKINEARDVLLNNLKK